MTPRPRVTWFLGAVGAAALGVGLVLLLDATDCQELECVAVAFGWGMVAVGVTGLLALVAGPLGFIAAILFLGAMLFIGMVFMFAWTPLAILPSLGLVVVAIVERREMRDFYFGRSSSSETP